MMYGVGSSVQVHASMSMDANDRIIYCVRPDFAEALTAFEAASPPPAPH